MSSSSLPYLTLLVSQLIIYYLSISYSIKCDPLLTTQNFLYRFVLLVV